MISNRNIVCISNMPWESDYAKTIAELMKVFAKNNTVLYVDSPDTMKDLLLGIIGKKNIWFKRVLGFENRLRKFEIDSTAYIYVLTPPPTLTINFLPKGFVYKQFLKFNGWLVRKSIQRSLRRLNMTDDLINITAFTPQLGVVNERKLKEKTLIYHCYDSIEFADWLKKHGPWLEKEFMQIADAVIVTSQGLFDQKKPLSRSCFLVKNAANIKLFHQGFNPEISNKKAIGYIGSIDDRLDYDLLGFLISVLPDVDFIFVGRLTDKKGEQILRQFKNVKLEGAKSVEQLPGYLKTFSLGIIPFAKNDFNKGIYPLKINEYLAAGIPVVSTNFSYLDEFKNIIRIAENKEDFKSFCEEELQNDSIEKKNSRVDVARQNSWEHRVDQFSDIITSLEKK